MPFPFVFLLACWLCLTAACAQPAAVGPEWINYGQRYYKIPVAQAGLYRITAITLRRAGVPIHTLNPGTLQLFHRGQEQAIAVAGEADGRFDDGDYLEFYGRGNDGLADSALYRSDESGHASAQPHPYYSLFSDTTAYFLTWRLDGKPGRRMAAYTDTAWADLKPETYHWAEELRLYTDTYPGYAAGIPPKIEYSHYEPGEGHTGVIQQQGTPYQHEFALPSLYRAGPAPQLEVLLAGRDYTDHRVDVRGGSSPNNQRLLNSISFAQYTNARIRDTLAWPDVSDGGRFWLSTVSTGNGPNPDRYSVSYLRLRYPQTLTAGTQSLYTFRLVPNPASRSLLTPVDVPRHARFFDITDPNAPVQVGATLTGTSARLVVRHTDRERVVLCTGVPPEVDNIRPVTFTDWSHRRPTYVIISHETLMKPTPRSPNAVQAYAAYRASAAGGGFDTLTVTMAQLIDQYSYGERHPLAIRRFIDELFRQSRQTGPRPAFLLLLGRGRSAAGVRHNPAAAELDMVMTMGFPSSDAALTAGLDGFPTDVPRLPTGRVNAATPAEVLAYLDKVMTHEQLPADTPWRKNVLHLSGGLSADEARLLRSLVDAYRQRAEGAGLGARVTTLSKQTDAPTERLDVARYVNEGIGLMTFFGHSGLDVTDLDIGFCSDDALGYRNQGRYPMLLINGCAIGNFFYGRPTLTTDWVLTPRRGAIAALALSHLGYIPTLNQYSTLFYQLISDSTWLDRPIGELQQETIRRVLAQSPGGLALANAQQMVLQGDPAIRLFPFRTVDYALSASDLHVSGANQQPLTASSDSVAIRFLVYNFGQYRPGPLPIRVRRLVNAQESGVYNLVWPSTVANRDTLLLKLPNERGAEGLNEFEISLNPADSPDSSPETNRQNNRATASVTIPGEGPAPISPRLSGLVANRQTRLVAQSFRSGSRTYALELDTTDRFDSPTRLNQLITTKGTIALPVTLTDLSPSRYFWRVREVSPQETPWRQSAFTFDTTRWQAGRPEGQLRLVRRSPDAVQQGDVVTILAEFTNLGPVTFSDSLLVQQTLFAASLSQPQRTTFRSRPVPPGDTLRIPVRLATAALPGQNRLLLTVNPYLQPEDSFLNNTLELALPVQPDRQGPLLEVAIDGLRITDGAVVSARPVIEVLVADDNRSLLRRDTTGLVLRVQRPGQPTFERLNWRSATLQPAGADNIFRARYASPTLPAGEYRLLVTAEDTLGNPAAPYQIRFRVVAEPEITRLTAYPNPFRDQIWFAVELTGNQTPGAATLTITDVWGRPVKRLRLDANGRSLRIGRNEWNWNGRDESGQPVPAGVYLYRFAVDADWPVADSVSLHGRIVLTR